MVLRTWLRRGHPGGIQPQRQPFRKTPSGRAVLCRAAEPGEGHEATEPLRVQDLPGHLSLSWACQAMTSHTLTLRRSHQSRGAHST